MQPESCGVGATRPAEGLFSVLLQSASRRWAGLLLAAGVASPVPVLASQLLAPAIGAPDTAMNGATVATPLTPTAAAFSNPAGLTQLEPGAVSFALGVPVGHSEIRASVPPGYDTTSDFVAYAPEGGSVYGSESGLRWGFAAYGSLGAVFDSDADASVGVAHDFLSAQSATNLALMVAMPIDDKLSFGVALQGIYGQVKLRYFQTVPFSYTVRGPGVQAIAGLRYQLTDRVALGASYRTPGMVWASGDSPLAGGSQDVDLHLDMPAQFFAGLNADLTDRIDVGVMARWTDGSAFGNSIFRFEKTPAADVAYIRGATDEWRFAFAVGYALTETLTVRASAGYADAIVPDSWVSPLIVDTNEWKVGGGLSWAVGGWIVDFAFGESPQGEREVSPSEAAVFPGNYTMDGQFYMIGLRTTL